MPAQVKNVVTKSGKVLESRFVATLTGPGGQAAGPYLQKQFEKLDELLRGQLAVDSVMAMGREIADEWAVRVPVEDANYRREMQGADVVRAGPVKHKDPEGLRVITGASGSVGPRLRPGLEDPVLGNGETKKSAQPALYAAALEFGQTTTGISGAFMAPQPSARPAFDAAQGRALDAAERVLKAGLDRFRP